MAGETISSNMNLIIPAVGVTDWLDAAPDLNSSLNLIDQHNHASGNGVAVSPPGLNINEDLPFQNSNATDLRSTRFISQGSPISDPEDLGCLYVSGVDLYYNDENGNQIRMTASGGVAGTPGSIGNLTPPASVTYVSATPAFVFQSDANTSADLDAGSVTIRENVANAKGITLSSPTSLAADYTITFPGALPASNKIVRIDNSGNLSASLGVDGSTIVISSNNLSVGTITDANIANNSISGAKITDSTIIANTKLANNPVFPGTHISITGGNDITVASGTYNLNGGAQNTLFLGYSGGGTGYRVVSGIVETDGSNAIRTFDGFTAVRNSVGSYTVTLSVGDSQSKVAIPTASIFTSGNNRVGWKMVVNANSSAMSVLIYDINDLLADSAFSFHIIVSA